MAEDASASRGPAPTISDSIGSSFPRRPGTHPGPGAKTLGLAIVLCIVLSIVLIEAVPRSSESAGNGINFRVALATASSVVSRFGGGYLDLAAGYDLPNATADPFDFSDTGCAVTSLVGPYPREVVLPPFNGDLMSGTAPAWWFWYVNPSTSSVTMIYVINGTVPLAFALSGAGCLAFDTSTPPLPAAVIDSPAAMSSAAPAGAGNFITVHPTGVSLTMSLQNLMTPAGFGPGEAAWVVYLTTGSAFFTPPAGSGCSEFNVGINATTGTASHASTYSCG